jgi:hypothetical protein
MLKRKKERKKIAPSWDCTHGPQFQCSLQAILAYLNTLQSGGNALPMVYLKSSKNLIYTSITDLY